MPFDTWHWHIGDKKKVPGLKEFNLILVISGYRELILLFYIHFTIFWFLKSTSQKLAEKHTQRYNQYFQFLHLHIRCLEMITPISTKNKLNWTNQLLFLDPPEN